MITAPTNCPSCDSVLEWSNDLLYCRNPDCQSTNLKKIEHFAKTLKIMGLGPASIERLEILSIPELYEMDYQYMLDQLGSEKVASKLHDEIEKSKTRSLNLVLPAFGIPLIGKTATDKLAAVCQTIFDINEEICKKAGLGPKATENLLDWLENTTYWEYLPFSYTFEKKTVSTSARGVVCISGKLNSFSTKQEAQNLLEELGYTVKSSLTKDVTILVNESGVETSKTQKARESGVLIVTDLKSFIGDNT